MTGEHAHDHAELLRGDLSPGSRSKRRLRLVLGFTTLYLAVLAVGSWMTHSLALLAEAGHMLTDVGGLALALFAIYLAERPATPKRTYGLYRVEILAAAINALMLMGLSAFVLYEAAIRLAHPPEIHSPMMVGIASVGLAVNVTGAVLLRGAAEKSLNVKAAYFEVVSDALSAVGVIVAGVIMWVTRWYRADAIVSVAIGLFILPRTWKLLGEAVSILLEGTPKGIDISALRQALGSLPGVAGVHDLHVWALTSGINAMSVHVVLAEGYAHDACLAAVHLHVREQFKIDHVTVQVESQGCEANEVHF
jgi:cobalt-zinc-cadmium efflux system protein